jgi:hypothetical protein
VKGGVLSLVLALGLLASGCGVFDVYRDRQMPAPEPSQPQARQAVPQIPPEGFPLPPLASPRVAPQPPYWYWADKQQQRADRYLQQQWQFYYENRQPPPQFQRQPICTSTLLGGQVLTNCY